MGRAWGVDSSGDVQRIWRDRPNVSDGATLEGLTVRFPADDVLASPRDIGARIVGGHPVHLAVTDGIILVNAAFGDVANQFREWAHDLLDFGSDVSTPGIRYLASAFQACRIVLGDATTYPHALATTIFTNAVLGASDITSPAAFAASAYAGRANPAPTRAMLWVDKITGARLPLSGMADYGPLTEDPPFTPPAAMRS